MPWIQQPRSSRSIWFLMALAVCMLSLRCRAQIVPSAYGSTASFWVGAEFSNVNASFPYQSGSRLTGASVFAEYHRDSFLGFTGVARFMNFDGFHNETEASYLFGPQFRFLQKARLQPFASGLIGVGRIQYPFQIGTGNYFAVAPVGGVDYRLQSRWSLRAEYEYEFWINSPGYVNEANHQLRPNGIHAGISFRLFH